MIHLRTVAMLAVLAGAVSATPVFLGPAPYLGFSDSPIGGAPYSYFHLDTYESGGPSAPGVSITPGWIVLGPSVFTDSVDADDGVTDGSGIAGNSLYSGNFNAVVRFSFSEAVLGSLPTHAGVVWTDVGSTTGTPGFGPVTFQAFGPGNVLLGTIGPVTLGDGIATGGTPEDRFFGVFDLDGISAIEISMSNSFDWEVDHLQFGRLNAVPEPGYAVLLLAASGTCAIVKARCSTLRI